MLPSTCECFKWICSPVPFVHSSMLKTEHMFETILVSQGSPSVYLLLINLLVGDKWNELRHIKLSFPLGLVQKNIYFASLILSVHLAAEMLHIIFHFCLCRRISLLSPRNRRERGKRRITLTEWKAPPEHARGTAQSIWPENASQSHRRWWKMCWKRVRLGKSFLATWPK